MVGDVVCDWWAEGVVPGVEREHEVRSCVGSHDGVVAEVAEHLDLRGDRRTVSCCGDDT